MEIIQGGVFLQLYFSRYYADHPVGETRMGGSQRNYLMWLKRKKKSKVLRKKSVMARGHEIVVLKYLFCTLDCKPTFYDKVLKINTEDCTGMYCRKEKVCIKVMSGS